VLRRKCNFDGKKLTAVVYGGAFLSDASFKGADMKEAVFTKAYAVGSNFSGADLSNAIIDRTNFSGSDFTGAVRASFLRESGPGGLTREVETPLPSNSPHDHMILRVDLVDSHALTLASVAGF
jgi:hypothetical protein